MPEETQRYEPLYDVLLKPENQHVMRLLSRKHIDELTRDFCQKSQVLIDELLDQKSRS